MKLKEFEWALQDVKQFDSPKVNLEQYPTSAHLAARVVYNAEISYGDIQDKKVLDLGCGPCILGIGAQIFGSAYTMGIDIDLDALNVARQNIEDFEVDVELVQANVSDIFAARGSEKGLLRALFHQPVTSQEDKTTNELKNQSTKDHNQTLWSEHANNNVASHGEFFDTVLMNPPFGTKPGNKGIDMVFLETGLKLVKVGGAVYSMHKSSTREHIQKKAQDWGCSLEVLAQMKFDIGKMYKFHKKKSVDVEVDLIRLERTK